VALELSDVHVEMGNDESDHAAMTAIRFVLAVFGPTVPSHPHLQRSHILPTIVNNIKGILLLQE
jgi:hypothetical protein